MDALRARDGDDVNPAAKTIFLTHGRPTETVFVLLHGYTSSPRQFERLAHALFERGCNVLVPRAPHHGMKDRLTGDTARQTAAGLLTYLNEALDIAQGLGSRVEAAGLSMGGVLALWAACRRPDIERASAIAPALAFHALPLRLTAAAGWLMRFAPNRFVWWDPKLRDKTGPAHAYPRYSTRGLAQFVHLGTDLRRFARSRDAAAARVLFILNPADENVDNTFALDMHRGWRRRMGDRIGLYQFDAELGLPHDLIDPEQPRQQVDVVYPILLDLLAT
jgi:carboxylesterase